MENVAKNIEKPQVFLAEAEALIKNITDGALELHQQYEQLKQLMLAHQESLDTKESTPPETDRFDQVKEALANLDYRLVEVVRARLFDHGNEVLNYLGITFRDIPESKYKHLNWLNQNCAEDIVLRIMKGEKPLERNF